MMLAKFVTVAKTNIADEMSSGYGTPRLTAVRILRQLSLRYA